MGRVESAYRDIEEVEEDERRARHEENRLHVQNMVMDNCLSVIKHETIYYPSRINALVEQALAGAGDVQLCRGVWNIKQLRNASARPGEPLLRAGSSFRPVCCYAWFCVA